MYSKTNRNRPLTADEIYDQILNRIISLQLEPGQRISENQMAKDYGVSRSVIRTAFTRLRQIGFIEIYPQRGTYVSLIDLDHISDLLILRTAVEKEVIYEIFKFLGSETRSELIARLEKNMNEQEKCRDEADYLGHFPELDSAFHKSMIDIVGRGTMMHMLDDSMLHVARWKCFDVAFDNRIPEMIRQHQAILDGIKAGDMYEAQERLADHLETVTSIADRAIDKYPSYFRSSELK
ncbi:MAG: GntR family transcriptional regulator [Clostridiales bacterium]|nr:GntR family transcriptional regulator [Clostridiales bacterium]